MTEEKPSWIDRWQAAGDAPCLGALQQGYREFFDGSQYQMS